MRHGIVMAAGLGFLMVGGAVRADDKAAAKPAAGAPAMEMPKPAPEMEQLKKLAGTQSCSGKMFASPMGPEGPMKGKIAIKSDLGGFWYAMRWDGAKSKTMPAMSASCLWGYDTAKKAFTEACVDSMGGIAHGSSKGWEGDKWVWEEENQMMGQKFKGHTIITKGKGKEVKVTSDMAGPDGKSMPLWETTCK